MAAITEGVARKSAGARGFAREFQEFLLKQNVVALAVGVVIGAAVGKVVSGVVDDVIMPIVGLVLPAGDWRQAKLALGGNNAILYGDLVGRLLDFAIVALVVFLILRALVRRPAPAPAPAMKGCQFCLETIPAAATRCRACGSTV
ncbi:large conductance mechanosensitive channel protein MscL [Anaeromyxobacter oryzae]|uniref:Large-conductance mechanosensitive channel n=1 Tax=Anaeromyxobacter oryzae TaxID=2918170 RepID=A0ABM7X0P3_9BACT|nr:large conductance mechanosensitive channel protein MscL [Anaeromyxobacter oryzae]BDG05375.1 large-conductance mechanosensitive channel [Anaeromyxobacter oryzae]